MSTSITLPSEKGDSWSFGSLSFEVFAGEDPYNLSTDLYVPVLLSQGVTPEHPGSNAVGLSPNMWELMQSCWKIDPLGRPSMHAIRSTIHEMRPPYDCVWFLVSLGTRVHAYPYLDVKLTSILPVIRSPPSRLPVL
jgi:Protein tyrosine and serine/threonine kinase